MDSTTLAAIAQLQQLEPTQLELLIAGARRRLAAYEALLTFVRQMQRAGELTALVAEADLDALEPDEPTTTDLGRSERAEAPQMPVFVLNRPLPDGWTDAPTLFSFDELEPLGELPMAFLPADQEIKAKLADNTYSPQYLPCVDALDPPERPAEPIGNRARPRRDLPTRELEPPAPTGTLGPPPALPRPALYDLELVDQIQLFARAGGKQAQLKPVGKARLRQILYHLYQYAPLRLTEIANMLGYKYTSIYEMMQREPRSLTVNDDGYWDLTPEMRARCHLLFNRD